MTSDETNEEKQKCLKLGADLFIEKPLTKESINLIFKKFNLI